MKKICILSAVNIKHMSLISIYTKYFEEHGIEYDIIYMDKYNEEEEIGAKNIYRFVNVIDRKWSKIHKVIKYSKFINYAKKVIKREKYDKIIVWNDVAILMFGMFLAKKCKHKYCLNCRDYNGENIPIVYYVFKKVIENSYFTTISSGGFRTFLPKHDYIDLYSYNDKLLQSCEPRKQLSYSPLRIGFIGNVRFFEENYKLLNCLKNDSRYEIHYHGSNADIVEEYAKSNGFNNVICSGAFQVNETGRYLDECDIINNIFGNENIAVKTLTSIRLFHAAHMHMPILVSKETYMEELINAYGIGYVVDFDDKDLANHLFEWYKNIDFEEFERNCDRLICIAIKSNNEFYDKLQEFLDK